MPVRIQLSRKPGYRKPEGSVVVTRPHSKFANPFRIRTRPDGSMEVWANGADSPVATFHKLTIQNEGVRIVYQCAVDWFVRWVEEQGPGAPSFEMIREELGGKNLACWCAPTDDHGRPFPCHADSLLRWANS